MAEFGQEEREHKMRVALDAFQDYQNGLNNKTKLIKRQMYGRAGFQLLRHRILLG